MTEDSTDPTDTPADEAVIDERERGEEPEEEQSPQTDEPTEERTESGTTIDGDQHETAAEETSATEKGDSRFSLRGRSPSEYLLWGAFLLSLFLAVISVLSLYLQVGSIIGIWVESRFQPLVRAGFDLAVLLLASYTALAFAKRLRNRD